MLERRLVYANRRVHLAFTVVDFAEERRRTRERRLQLQRFAKRDHSVCLAAEEMRGDAGAEMQRGVARTLAERVLKNRRGPFNIPRLQRLKASVCLRGLRRG